jgi:ankyrin repeat protein
MKPGLLSILLFAFLLLMAFTKTFDQQIFENAVVSGDFEQTKMQIALGAPINAEFPVDSTKGESLHETPLIIAALNARPDVVKLLIARGADVNKKSAIGTPLMYAAQCTAWGEASTRRLPRDATDCIEVVKTLLAEGADKHVRNAEGLSAAEFAERSENEQIAMLLRK